MEGRSPFSKEVAEGGGGVGGGIGGGGGGSVKIKRAEKREWENTRCFRTEKKDEEDEEREKRKEDEDSGKRFSQSLLIDH